jgi:Flp pilus assembly pilin Flp
MEFWWRFWRDESAQDLIEYAYLAAIIGLSGALLWSGIAQLIGDRYTDYNADVQAASATTPDP